MWPGAPHRGLGAEDALRHEEALWRVPEEQQRGAEGDSDAR